MRLSYPSNDDFINNQALSILETLVHNKKMYTRYIKTLGTWVVSTVRFAGNNPLESLLSRGDCTYRAFALAATYIHQHPEQYQELFEDFRQLVEAYYRGHTFYNLKWLYHFLRCPLALPESTREEVLFVVACNLLMHSFLVPYNDRPSRDLNHG